MRYIERIIRSLDAQLNIDEREANEDPRKMSTVKHTISTNKPKIESPNQINQTFWSSVGLSSVEVERRSNENFIGNFFN